MKINLFGKFILVFLSVLLPLVTPFTATAAEDDSFLSALAEDESSLSSPESGLMEQKTNVKLVNTTIRTVKLRMILPPQEKIVVLYPKKSMDEIFTYYTDPANPEKIRFQVIAKPLRPHGRVWGERETSVYFDRDAFEFEGHDLVIEVKNPIIYYDRNEWGTEYVDSIAVEVGVDFAQHANSH